MDSAAEGRTEGVAAFHREKEEYIEHAYLSINQIAYIF